MEPVICPFCGRENDQERDTCRYCQARLRPLHLNPPTSPEISSSEPSDWLAGFRDQVSTQGLSAEEPASENNQPAGLPLSSAQLEPEEPDDGLATTASTEMVFEGSSGSLMLDRILGVNQPFIPGPVEQEPGQQQPPHRPPGEEDEVKSEFSLEFSEEPPTGIYPDSTPAHDDLAWLRDLQSHYEETDDLSVTERDEGWLEATQLNRSISNSDREKVPGWVDEISAGPLELESRGLGGEMAGDSLPAWLDSMRSSGTSESMLNLPPEYRGQVEIAGPLAGLQGILPAEPEISLGQKGAASGVTPQVTETHRLQAEIFDRVIQSEGKNKPVPDKYLVTSQKVMRLAFAAVILLAVLVPVFSRQALERAPLFPPDEVLSTSQIISVLETGSPVLIAVEYDPGFSGELDAALAAVMDHLMIKGAILVLVSTNSFGPMQAEHIVDLSNRAGSHNYVSSEERQDYINLGFISGGMSGVRNFALNPHKFVASEISSTQNSEIPALVNIQTINDFAAVIVASESYEKSRLWIEQVSPLLQDTPLIFVSSAQSNPLISPYFHASPQQVQGIVSGLMGSVQYEAATGRQGLAQLYWPSFNSGLLAAALLILIGGGANALLTLASEKEGRSKGGKSR